MVHPIHTIYRIAADKHIKLWTYELQQTDVCTSQNNLQQKSLVIWIKLQYFGMNETNLATMIMKPLVEAGILK